MFETLFSTELKCFIALVDLFSHRIDRLTSLSFEC
jgi:hypothetical protein